MAAGVVKLVDTLRSGRSARKGMEVQVLSPAPKYSVATYGHVVERGVWYNFLMSDDNYTELKQLVEEVRVVARENNKILRSIRRISIIELVLRVVWYTALIGLPFALYYYVLAPYFALFGTSYEDFNAGLRELPGVQSIANILGR